MKSAEEIISFLDLMKHPEGGYYREVYRSDEILSKEHLPERFTMDHTLSTSIYFLLSRDTFSAFHTIKQDEIWHFYGGAPLDVHIIHPDGNHMPLRLGSILEGELPQGTIPAGTVFGAKVCEHPEYDYALVGCAVAPGFEFDDFTLHSRAELLRRFPQHRTLVMSLTREDAGDGIV
ncbi:MAG: cupin domain-containing protein [Spirochaetota bacterium]